MSPYYAVVIPTLNARGQIDKLIDALQAQTARPREIVVVDSGSTDGTVALAMGRRGVRVIVIDRDAFDHGGTRDMALRSCDAPVVVMMTQDALPEGPRCMEALLAPLADDRVAAVCGRQVARADARASEKEVRAYRYPAESRAWGREDVPKLGMRAYLLSDVCTAYRRAAYDAVGGFVHPLVTNEDMLIAADFLDAGWRLAYSADARVLHSHNHTLRQEYERNRKIGRFLARYSHRFGEGGELGEGVRMVKAVSLNLLRRGRVGSFISFGFHCVARFLGNRRGRREGRLTSA